MTIAERQPTPRAAAIELIRWWKDWFGASWYRFYAASKATPWSFVPCDGGFRMNVYLMGKPYFIGRRWVGTGLHRRRVWVPVTDRPAIFATRQEATVAFRKFLWWRYGLAMPFAGLELRKEYMTSPIKDRVGQVPAMMR